MYNAVKALGGGRIEAYAVRWGSASEPDRSATKDYFTPNTDLMLSEWGWPRPILLEHMVTPEGDAAGSVGSWAAATRDRIGVKLSGQLKTDHPLYPQIDRDIRAGRYFLSSDSAPHLVKRRPQPNGTHELTRWGLLTASLTKTPAEHRLLPVAAVKHLGLKAGARHSAADQQALQAAHDALVNAGAQCGMMGKSHDQRRLLAELELIAIEAEYARTMSADDLRERKARLELELIAIEREYARNLQ